MIRMWKKLALLLALLLAVSALCACGGETAEEPQTDDTQVADTQTAAEETPYGLQLPEGCEAEEADGALYLTKDGEEIGGVITVLCTDPSAVQAGVENDQLQEVLDQIVIGEADYIVSDSSYGSIEVSMTDGTDEITHYLFPAEGLFYDLWLNQSVVTSDEAASLAGSFTLPE
jgi:hypothetical protein